MATHVVGSEHFLREIGNSRGFRVGKQILNTLVDRATAAADRSRFAALPSRYLDDVGMTEAERVAALGCEEPTIDGWRIVATHL